MLLLTCRRDARARYGVLKDRPTPVPGAYQLAYGWWFTRWGCHAQRDAPSELHSVPTIIRGEAHPGRILIPTFHLRTGWWEDSPGGAPSSDRMCD
jgi:hypothetical protein